MQNSTQIENNLESNNGVKEVKPFLRRYLKQLLSIVMIIIALVGLLDTNSFIVSAGAGRGNGDKVTTLEDLQDVLDFIVNKNHSNLSNQTNLLYNGTLPPANLSVSKSKKSKHDSVTVVEEAVLDMKGYSLKRTLKIYFTEDASYYESNGTFQYVSASDSENNYYYQFDVQIYIDDKTALLKINQASFFGENIKSEYVNKWVELPEEEVWDVLESIDDLNRGGLGALSNYIDEVVDEDYELEGTNFSGTTSSLVGIETSVNISFFDPQNPNVEIAGSSDDINMFASYTFSNIDNTIIKANTDKATEIDSLEDMFEEEN